MFDVVAKPDSHVIINAFDDNDEETDDVQIQVYTRDGTWVGYDKNASDWQNMGLYTVQGGGRGNPTHVVLNSSVVVPSNSTRAFYIVQVNGGDNTQNIEKTADSVGILVGTVIEYLPFSTDDDKEYSFGRDFSGSIYYTACDGRKPDDVSAKRSMLRGRKLIDFEYHNREDIPEGWNHYPEFDIFFLLPSPVSKNSST